MTDRVLGVKKTLIGLVTNAHVHLKEDTKAKPELNQKETKP